MNFVVLEKAFRGRIPKRVPVRPKTGKPYLAIRWTTGARTEDLGREAGHNLKELVKELPNLEERRYLKNYIRYLFGQRQQIPGKIQFDLNTKIKLRGYERRAKSIVDVLPLTRHQQEQAAPRVLTPVRERTAPREEKTEVQRGWNVDSNKIAKYLKKKIAQGLYTTWDSALARVKEVFPEQSDSRYERALEKAGLRKPKSPVTTLMENEWSSILALPGGPHKEYFQLGEVEEILKLGGGINQTFRIKFKDDGEGCWKPVSGEVEARGHHIKRGSKGEYFRREAGTYSVARILGMEDLVPETYVRNDPNEGVGSVMAWVWGGMAGAEEKIRYKKDFIRGGFLDFMCENMDRHSGNYFVTEGGKLQMIDNGLSFGNDSKWNFEFNAQLIKKSRYEVVPKELLRRVVNSKDEVVRTLGVLGFDNGAIARYKERAEIAERFMGKERVDLGDLVDEYMRV